MDKMLWGLINDNIQKADKMYILIHSILKLFHENPQLI